MSTNPQQIDVKAVLHNHVKWLQELGVSDVYMPELKEHLAALKQTKSVVQQFKLPAQPPKPPQPPVKKTIQPPPKPVVIDTVPLPATLGEYRQQICDCSRCDLHKTRTNFVFGEGNPQADIVFVGEAPGAEEDRTGQPFVGPAGQLLNKILQAIDLERDDVFICNILKCRPPQNRDPNAQEVELCEPYLVNQLKLIQPKIICALGRVAIQTLLRSKQSLSRLRNQVFDYHGVKLMATYHPAALLRYPKYKRDTWEDFKMLRRIYDEA